MDEDTTVAAGDMTVPPEAEELLNVTNLVKTYINKIDTLTESVKKASEMLADILDNDDDYRDQIERAKDITKQKNQAKQRVLNTPQAKDLVDKVKEGKQTLKEMKSTLSEYLTEYARMSGSNEFEDDAGVMHKIVYLARLVKQ